MVQIVLSLNEENEKKLRKLAMDKYGGKKGSLSKIVEEGIEMVSTHEEKSKAEKELWEMSNNAKNWNIGKFTREEANER